MKDILEKIIWISAIILFIGLPLSKGLISIGTVGMIISTIAYFILVRRPDSIRPALPILILGSFYVFYLISLFYSANIREGWNQIIHQHGFVTIPLIIWILWEWFNSKIFQLLDLFTFACLAGCIITLTFYMLPESSVQSLTEYLGFLQSYPSQVDRVKFGLYSPFIDRLHFSYLLSFAILYELYVLIRSNHISIRSVKVIIFLIAIILLGARGAQISLLISLSVGMILFGNYKFINQNLSRIDFQQRMAILISAVLIITIVLPVLAYKNIPVIQKRYDQMTWELSHVQSGAYLEMDYENFTTLTRIRALQNAWHLVKENPLWGVGIGDFDDAMLMANNQHKDRVPVHNQNFFLYLWASCGIGGLMALILAMINFIYQLWRHSDFMVKTFILSYILFVFFCSLIDVIWIFQIGNISLPLFLSSIFIISKKHPSFKP